MYKLKGKTPWFLERSQNDILNVLVEDKAFFVLYCDSSEINSTPETIFHLYVVDKHNYHTYKIYLFIKLF